MDFFPAIESGFKKYVTFSGRASRSEYWYWVLFTMLAGMLLGVLDAVFFPMVTTQDARALQPLGSLFSIITFLPGLAVSIRRLHDTNHSGWWTLIALTGIGIIVLIIFYCQRGTEGSNEYGPDPLTNIMT